MFVRSVGSCYILGFSWNLILRNKLRSARALLYVEARAFHHKFITWRKSAIKPDKRVLLSYVCSVTCWPTLFKFEGASFHSPLLSTFLHSADRSFPNLFRLRVCYRRRPAGPGWGLNGFVSVRNQKALIVDTRSAVNIFSATRCLHFQSSVTRMA